MTQIRATIPSRYAVVGLKPADEHIVVKSHVRVPGNSIHGDGVALNSVKQDKQPITVNIVLSLVVVVAVFMVMLASSLSLLNRKARVDSAYDVNVKSYERMVRDIPQKRAELSALCDEGKICFQAVKTLGMRRVLSEEIITVYATAQTPVLAAFAQQH